jgi:hypothetical protein
MNSGNWQHSSTAPFFVKLLAYVSLIALGFFLVHTLVMFNGSFNAAVWTQELYFNIWVALPLFLFITGKSVLQKPQGKILIVLALLFGICYLLNVGNTYEWVDIRHLQYPMSILLLGILITWITAVLKRKKTMLDGLKFLWLFGFIYSYIVPRFVPSGHEAGNFLLGSMFVFPFMMALGFVQFFRKPKPAEYAT